MTRKHFPCYWPFVRGIHQSLVDPPYKRPVMQNLFPLYVWTNCRHPKLNHSSHGKHTSQQTWLTPRSKEEQTSVKFESNTKFSLKKVSSTKWWPFLFRGDDLWLLLICTSGGFFIKNISSRNISLYNLVWGSIKPVWLLQPSLLHRLMSCYCKHLCTNICFSDISSLWYWYLYN